MGKGLQFAVGAVLGAAAGTVVGLLIAPRPGAETRAMAADMANDAWDTARDMYEQGVDQARAAATDFGPMMDAKTDELRAKVDLARERMDQLRESLNEAIAGGDVTPAADVVVEANVPEAPADEAPVEA
ncbi:MAG: YtxH domain-containing protein [Collinsella sp.]|nr:YtxH domain-containing protein [Collinsella sp.]